MNTYMYTGVLNQFTNNLANVNKSFLPLNIYSTSAFSVIRREQSETYRGAAKRSKYDDEGCSPLG